ncbi:sigma factor-like helix-turn-helix DNA-binding protein [Streptomyces fragilis]|uniref:Sigma factor-like helix-turn-helix DNA-binding protein n=1 Tax=Streptomyces fragilis TaxID=67301 RepID=A0ABV2YDM4_9ACTN|nr:sigma factor-like helix-turn-helix DNA-binding protein [Streptomyces fragilis]
MSKSSPPEPDEPPQPRRRPGPELGQIVPRVVGAHRSLLLVMRERHRLDGRSLGDLKALTGQQTSKISELLRGVGPYPRWDNTEPLVEAMRLPRTPLLRLWRQGALEAERKAAWIKGNKGAEDDGETDLPVSLQGMRRLHGAAYLAYAEIFLHPEAAAEVMERTFHVLWAREHVMLSSDSAPRFAWAVFREQVMERADERVALPEAALRTASLHEPGTSPGDEWLLMAHQVNLFTALRGLAARHADVLLLRHVLGLSTERTALVLGTHPGMVRVWQRQAESRLEADPGLRSLIEGMTR